MNSFIGKLAAYLQKSKINRKRSTGRTKQIKHQSQLKNSFGRIA